MAFEFDWLLNALNGLLDRRVRVLYQGGVHDGTSQGVAAEPRSDEDDSLPMLPQPGVRIGWAGRLAVVRVRPDPAECRRFRLRPQVVGLYFLRGPRLEIDVNRITGFSRRDHGVTLQLKGRAYLRVEPIFE